MLLSILLLGAAVASPLVSAMADNLVKAFRINLVRYSLDPQTREWTIKHMATHAPFEVEPMGMTLTKEFWYINIEGRGFTTQHINADQWKLIEHGFHVEDGNSIKRLTIDGAHYEETLGRVLAAVRSISPHLPPVLFVDSVLVKLEEILGDDSLHMKYWLYEERMLSQKGNGAGGVVDSRPDLQVYDSILKEHGRKKGVEEIIFYIRMYLSPHQQFELRN
ncbi:hypothetical protein J3R30DRAFT_3407875 [Lentinula aciculospora]|uniref:Uncharacterized protein n=1 Tax=Lentinula aciculospora TaxID=153920 RepID=A0A9W9A0Q1_9AGAR|nr:hypothetical protein J3R30DRAFT_3407875 [Lentinula aciculospora]